MEKIHNNWRHILRARSWVIRLWLNLPTACSHCRRQHHHRCCRGWRSRSIWLHRTPHQEHARRIGQQRRSARNPRLLHSKNRNKNPISGSEVTASQRMYLGALPPRGAGYSHSAPFKPYFASIFAHNFNFWAKSIASLENIVNFAPEMHRNWNIVQSTN